MCRGRRFVCRFMSSSSPSGLDLIQDLIARALKRGADAADALIVSGTSLSASYRMGKLEDVERSEGRDLGLRVLIGKRQAIVSSTDHSPATLEALIDRAIAIAKIAPEDKYCGLADPALLARQIPDLDLDDGSDVGSEALAERAREAEEAALSVAGVTNSGGAGASFGRSHVALATSTGFAGSYSGTSHSVSCSVIAGEGNAMERDYEFSSCRYLDHLEAADAVGRAAGERAVRRLKPRKIKSQSVPVVYDPRVSNGLVGHFAGAISGSSIARGTSFLKDRLGKQIFKSGVRIIDDPLRPQGLRSKPFDGEGLATERLDLVADGALQCWILDSATARQLNLQSNGRAARGTGGTPSPSTTNLYLAPGGASPEALIADIAAGFYVTELIGMGVNGVTGDYSRGAAGFWIENGQITHPVSEVTVAGNLKDMFLHLDAANDLTFKYGTNAPTVRIEGMTVAGA